MTESVLERCDGCAEILESAVTCLAYCYWSILYWNLLARKEQNRLLNEQCHALNIRIINDLGTKLMPLAVRKIRVSLDSFSKMTLLLSASGLVQLLRRN